MNGCAPAALCALLIAMQAPSSDLSEARRLINAGDPRGALHVLAGAVAEAGSDRANRIELLRGVAAYHAGDAAEAIKVLTPVVGRFHDESIERREAEQVLGLSLSIMGRYAEAVPRLEATRRWAPDNQELGYALGQAYIHTQKPDDARRVLASVFDVPPHSPAAHLVTAQLMIRFQMEPQAEAELLKALEKDPRLPHANFLLGQMALFRGRLDDAVAWTKKELDVNPGNAMALSQLGDALVRQSKWDEAIEALQKSIWLNPYYSAPYILLGRAYVRKDQPAAAEGMLRRAIEYDPNNRTAHYMLAQVLQQLGRTEEAKAEFAVVEKLKGAR